MEKTNVMRLLDAKKIAYTSYSYPPEITDGEEVAKQLGEDAHSVFKTLVTVSDKGEHAVFCVPLYSARRPIPFFLPCFSAWKCSAERLCRLCRSLAWRRICSILIAPSTIRRGAKRSANPSSGVFLPVTSVFCLCRKDYIELLKKHGSCEKNSKRARIGFDSRGSHFAVILLHSAVFCSIMMAWS